MALSNTIKKSIINSANVISNSADLAPEIELSINHIVTAIKTKRKVILLGNGGSAADAQHIAAEFIGRFNKERPSIPAIALTTDSSIITSIGNDYSFDSIFSRQCEGLVNDGDVVIAISTSGNSKNVLEGIKMAKKKNAKIIGLLGNGGGIIAPSTDIPIIVNSSSTPRIQEGHRLISHIICEVIEKNVVEN